MSIKQHIAAQRQQGQKPAAARARAKKAEGQDDDEGMEGEDEDDAEAEGEDESEPKGKKAAKRKGAKGKKAEGEEDETEAEGEEDDAEAEGEEDEETMAADPGTVAQLCANAGIPHMAKPLIDAKLPIGKVKRRIEGASQVRGLVAAAGRISAAVDPGIAEDFIKTGASPDHVKAKLFDMVISTQSPEVMTALSNEGRAARPGGDFGWGSAVERLNKQRVG